jgi:hypothetical protein
MDAPSRAGVARTLDTLTLKSGTHTLASVEPPSYDSQGAGSAADRLYSSGCYPPAPERTLHGGVAIHSLVPKTSQEFPASRSVAQRLSSTIWANLQTSLFWDRDWD